MKKSPLLAIFLTIFIDLVGVGLVIPVITPLLIHSQLLFSPATEYATRSLVLGLLLASYPFWQFFGSPLLGALSDRYGRKKVLLISLLGTMAGYVLFAIGIITNQLWLLFVARSLDGFTGGNIATAMSVISDVSKGPQRTKNFGLVGMAFGLGFILGPYLGGKLSDPTVVSWFNNATPFWTAALLCLLNIALLLVRFAETLKTKIETKITPFTGFVNIGRAWNMVNLRRVFIVVFLLTTGFTFFTQFFQLFLLKRFNFSNSQIGDVFAFIGLSMAITQGFITRLSIKRFKPEVILTFAMLGLVAVFPVLTLPQIPWHIFLVLPFVALFQGHIQPNITTIISNFAGAEAQGEVLGINQSVQSLAMITPPVISGLVASIHYTLPIFAASLFTFLAWLMFMNVRRHYKNEKFHAV